MKWSRPGSCFCEIFESDSNVQPFYNTKPQTSRARRFKNLVN